MKVSQAGTMSIFSRKKAAPDSSDIAQIKWFHTIDLGDGRFTPGADNTPEKFKLMNLPDSFAGKSVIDIGAWDGGVSFECERRGAARVLATDSFVWGNEALGGRKGFDLARRILNSRVEDKTIRVEDLSPSSVGTFDVVLFLGVLYHAPDPLGYLRVARSICKGVCYIETHVDMLDIGRPALAFYEGTTLNGDPSNFFGPNQLAVEAMCREVGFRTVKKIGADPRQSRLTFEASV
jgi:tRNA (mo5U34)-methyltransferase